jgi:hypothetical protein
MVYILQTNCKQAAFVSLSLLIPFAIYGLNLFVGQLQSCNDGDFPGGASLRDCVGEYNSSPFDWDVLAPRQAANPYYDFDNFGDALFILFQIVSQEGWTDNMWTAMSITGVYTQPEDRARRCFRLDAICFRVYAQLHGTDWSRLFDHRPALLARTAEAPPPSLSLQATLFHQATRELGRVVLPQSCHENWILAENHHRRSGTASSAALSGMVSRIWTMGDC